MERLMPKRAKPLEPHEASVRELTIPKLDTLLWEDLDVERFNEEYALPVSPTCPSIDSLWFCKSADTVHMFQLTVHNKLDYKSEGLLRVIEAYKAAGINCDFSVYMVVPPDVYPLVGYQTYKNISACAGPQIKTIGSIKQFKLELSLDEEQFKRNCH